MTAFHSDFSDCADDSVGLSFVQVYNLWHRQIQDALRAFQLTHPQFVVLSALGYLTQAQDEVSQQALSAQSGIDAMTISTIVRNLEKMALVSRRLSASDSRAKSVRLTAEGIQRMNAALPVVERIDKQFFDVLGEQRGTFNALLLDLQRKNGV